MSTPINDTGEGCHNPLYSQPGMILRDYLAGQALAGILSSGDVKIEKIISDKWAAASLSQTCYIIAEAVLKAKEARK